MVKRHLRQGSIMFFVLAALLTNLLLSACTDNVGSTSTGVTPVTQLSSYNAPSWWNGKTCDQGHYPEAKLLTTWRGIQVCGPIPWKTTGNKDVAEDFHGHGASQLEFECPELVARYLLAAYGLDSQQADGWQIVDAYTSLPGTPFYKVVNDGSIPMAPVEGDVLSYGASDPGHTSIVTNSSVDGNGNGTIGVIEQNVAESGAAMLTMTNWVIQHDAYHIGTVASWMTTRHISSQQPTTVPPTAVPPTAVIPPTPQPPATPTPVFTSGTWQGQGTYNNGQSSFDMVININSVSDSNFSGTLREDVYNTTVSITGAINGDTISFTDTSYVSGDQIQLNCTYTATVSNGQMSGVWYYPGNTSPDGTITLQKTS